MQNFIWENRRNNHNNDQDDRSIVGSQHKKWSRIADRSIRPIFREETKACTPDSMVTEIVDEVWQVRNEWDSLLAYVQDNGDLTGT